ncbi:nitroreductase [Marinobacter panjinensis]|uniref:Putative NAD(P)H nitroreductase n=1 Tax=Marinobacter panjinensis TaxID=2576384 RepID=A0A4U6QZH7_9GAMM|nr:MULTISPECIES: nitroreductase family protein [Marinobacter]MCR8915543.1 nitroreductase family protein [Marinobacter panjinensis]MDK8465278.1 nitroreductase family protein [Marinobacter sp. SS13-12]TKV66794.1 nitroreductase [Marinobacter panjinensis]
MTAVMDALLNRSSESRLAAPAPDAETLEKAFACAARAPDHALLRPWRYLVIEGEEALTALGELFASTCDEDAPDKVRDKLRQNPLRAPMIIVGIVSHQTHPKVPEIEQTMSAAVGMGYLLLALEAAGYGGMWRTGGLAYNPDIAKGLGLEDHETITGFLYTGSVSSAKPPVPRPDPKEFVSRWPR